MAPVTSSYYEGTGYSKILINRRYSVLLITMLLKFRSENGLILYIGSKVSHLPLSGCLLCLRQSLMGFSSLST